MKVGVIRSGSGPPYVFSGFGILLVIVIVPSVLLPTRKNLRSRMITIRSTITSRVPLRRGKTGQTRAVFDALPAGFKTITVRIEEIPVAFKMVRVRSDSLPAHFDPVRAAIDLVRAVVDLVRV